jgi:hypothetical protein
MISALLRHEGLSRTVLTSRIRPAGLDDQRVLVRAIHGLSLSEQVLQARELPHLGALLRGESPAGDRGAELVVGVLKEAQGLPALLVLADGQAADPQRLATQLEQIEVTAPTDLVAGEVFLREGHSPLSDQDFLHKLEAWTWSVAGAIPPDTRILFHVLCALEEEDRQSWVLEATWANIWHRLGHQGEPPVLDSALGQLADAGLVEINPVGGSQLQYRVHPSVAGAGRSQAGVGMQELVDTELETYWANVHNSTLRHEQRGGGALVLRAARSAVPYLLRREHWNAAITSISQVLTHDGSSANLAWAIPQLRRLAEVTRGTPNELNGLAALAVAFHNSGANSAAEPVLRKVADLAAAADPGLESSTLGELIDLLSETGRITEALGLVDRMKDASLRAHLGPWTLLADEGYRLQLLRDLGNNNAVLSVVEALRREMDVLPDESQQDERISPWAVREGILQIGQFAAISLRLWSKALDLNAAILNSMKKRSAPDRQLALARYDSCFPLVESGRGEEVRPTLEWCRAVFELEHDVGRLELVFMATAHLESSLHHYSQAIACAETALRYGYVLWDATNCAAGHNNLAAYIDEEGGDVRLRVHHLLAAGIIRFQTLEDLQVSISRLSQLVTAYKPEQPPFPHTSDELCEVVERVEGVRFRELFERLPHRAADGDTALRELLQMARAVAEQINSAAAVRPDGAQ